MEVVGAIIGGVVGCLLLDLLHRAHRLLLLQVEAAAAPGLRPHDVDEPQQRAQQGAPENPVPGAKMDAGGVVTPRTYADRVGRASCSNAAQRTPGTTGPV